MFIRVLPVRGSNLSVFAFAIHEVDELRMLWSFEFNSSNIAFAKVIHSPVDLSRWDHTQEKEVSTFIEKLKQKPQ
jgi:hypothetical protein